MGAADDIDWGPAEEAARWIREGRLRDALAILPSLGRAGVIAEDAVIDGDSRVVARTEQLLGDGDPGIAGRAAHLLGERAYRLGSAAEMERPLLEALRAALKSDPDRVSPLAAALRECARVRGARDAAPELVEIVRRNALGRLGELELMWASEALFELGWGTDRIVDEVGSLGPELSNALRPKLADLERGMRAAEPHGER